MVPFCSPGAETASVKIEDIEETDSKAKREKKVREVRPHKPLTTVMLGSGLVMYAMLERMTVSDDDEA
jgi:hypothetical protein